MAEKTLGQVAWSAYNGTLCRGAEESWQAVADAVVAAHESRLAEADRERDAAEALVAVLLGALEEAGDVIHACVCETEEIRGKVCHPSCMAINTALALTPASAGARLKGETLREAADSVPEGADAHNWFYMLAEKYTAEAEQEAANGR